MKTVLLTIFVVLLLAVLGIVGFIYSGWYDVAALTPDNPVVAWALRRTASRSVAARLKEVEVPPGLETPQAVKAGARLFGEYCVVCHGGPGLERTAIAQGLNPRPPDLFRAGRRPLDMDEAFWFVKNGVKMTAMPGFGKTLADEKIWSIAAFLRTAPGMSPQDFLDQTEIRISAPEARSGGG